MENYSIAILLLIKRLLLTHCVAGHGQPSIKPCAENTNKQNKKHNMVLRKIGQNSRFDQDSVSNVTYRKPTIVEKVKIHVLNLQLPE